MRAVAAALLFTAAASAQEASSGFELRTTLSAATFTSPLLSDAPRDGSQEAAGFRAMLYPIWKLNSHWAISGAIQVRSRPYFAEEFSTQGYGARADVLQLHLSYTRFWGRDRSLVVRLGQLSPGFGAFMQRYDSADNPLIGVPSAYGYYYRPVTLQGLAGVEVDATAGKLDARAQYVNSSPANRRSVFDRDQYGDWIGGVGYTIRQGFRVGGSAYYGPYLDRHYPFYVPGEAKPRELPSRGYGLDVRWARGHWNAWGELQRFVMTYRVVPTFTQHTGYAEVRRVLSPRWFAAARIQYLRQATFVSTENYELGAGFRPAANQLVKFSYTIQHGAPFPGAHGNIAAIEYVTWFRALSFGRN